MKIKAFKTILILLSAVLFASCEEVDVLQPQAAMSVKGDKYVFGINETMEIHFTGQAENVVIYTGDKEHDYELREQSNYGLVVNKGLFTYSYQQPGSYKVVCVATNHGDAGNIIKRDTCSLMVRVVDDATTINRLSAQVYYDEVFAKAVNDEDWFLSMPRKIILNNKEVNVKLSQKLMFSIDSDSTSINIDGKLYAPRTSYNLENVLGITVRSHEGTERNYKLYTVNYGEFETFAISGETASEMQRSAFDYSYHEIKITVPAGTDISAIAPTFTLHANNKVYVGDVEQVSGTTTHDFTTPVTYRFVASHPERPNLTVESTCVVTVTAATE